MCLPFWELKFCFRNRLPQTRHAHLVLTLLDRPRTGRRWTFLGKGTDGVDARQGEAVRAAHGLRHQPNTLALKSITDLSPRLADIANHQKE